MTTPPMPDTREPITEAPPPDNTIFAQWQGDHRFDIGRERGPVDPLGIALQLCFQWARIPAKFPDARNRALH